LDKLSPSCSILVPRTNTGGVFEARSSFGGDATSPSRPDVLTTRFLKGTIEATISRHDEKLAKGVLAKELKITDLTDPK